ncbi:hypothetical protein U1700_12505, partial [Sphingomonas sp. RB1R13]
PWPPQHYERNIISSQSRSQRVMRCGPRTDWRMSDDDPLYVMVKCPLTNDIGSWLGEHLDRRSEMGCSAIQCVRNCSANDRLNEPGPVVLGRRARDCYHLCLRIYLERFRVKVVFADKQTDTAGR